MKSRVVLIGIPGATEETCERIQKRIERLNIDKGQTEYIVLNHDVSYAEIISLEMATKIFTEKVKE